MSHFLGWGAGGARGAVGKGVIGLVGVQWVVVLCWCRNGILLHLGNRSVLYIQRRSGTKISEEKNQLCSL